MANGWRSCARRWARCLPARPRRGKADQLRAAERRVAIASPRVHSARTRLAAAERALTSFVEANRDALLAEHEPSADAAVARLEDGTREIEVGVAEWFERQRQSGALAGRRDVGQIPSGDALERFARAARDLREAGIPRPFPSRQAETIIEEGL